MVAFIGIAAALIGATAVLIGAAIPGTGAATWPGGVTTRIVAPRSAGISANDALGTSPTPGCCLIGNCCWPTGDGHTASKVATTSMPLRTTTCPTASFSASVHAN